MRILQVHNFYVEPGGEDQVVAAEYAMLTGRGHAVRQFVARNREVHGIGASAALRSIWNQSTYRAAQETIREFRPDVVHVHNTLAEISPAIYYAASSIGVPVVQTLHNYRLLCSGATLFRDGAVCEKCVGLAAPFYAPLYKCYRNSVSASAAVTGIIATHKLAGTWRTKIHRYLATTEFARNKFIEGGLPAAKIAVKPNFLARDPGFGSGSGDYVLYAGRLAPGKGIEVLLRAARRGPHVKLKIAGDGPLAPQVQTAGRELRNIEWLGHCAPEQVLELMLEAQLLVFPSVAYESLPMSVIESLACGTPVVCSNTPSLSEAITDGDTGYLFEASSEAALSAAIERALSNPTALKNMRRAARAAYESRYSASANCEQMLTIYRDVIAERATESSSSRRSRKSFRSSHSPAR